MHARTRKHAGRPASIAVNAAFIRESRERAGLTRENLALRVGVTTRTLQRAENQGLASSDLIERLSEALGVPLNVAPESPDDDGVSTAKDNRFSPVQADDFFGRVGDMADLMRLWSSQEGAHLVVISGPPGSGKTSLASHLAERVAPRWPGCVTWVRRVGDEPFETQRQICTTLGADAEGALENAARCGLATSQTFATAFWNQPRVLVLEDVVDPQQIRAFLGDEPRAMVIATTAFRSVGDFFADQHFEIPPLPEDVTREILYRGIDTARTDGQTYRESSMMGVALGNPGIAGLLNRIMRREMTNALRNLDEATSATAADFRTFLASLRTQVSQDVWRVLGAMGCFGRETLSVDRAVAAAGISSPHGSAALSVLIDIGLAEPSGSTANHRQFSPLFRLTEFAAIAARQLHLEALN